MTWTLRHNHALQERLARDGLGPLAPFLRNARVTSIRLAPSSQLGSRGAVWLEAKG